MPVKVLCVSRGKVSEPDTRGNSSDKPLPYALYGVTVLKKISCTLRKLDRFPMRYFLLHNQMGSGAIDLIALPVSWH